MNIGHLPHPQPPVRVLHLKKILRLPVEIVREIGYLLMNPVEGVAYDPPGSACAPLGSTWKTLLQFGQVTVNSAVPLLLIRR